MTAFMSPIEIAFTVMLIGMFMMYAGGSNPQPGSSTV